MNTTAIAASLAFLLAAQTQPAPQQQPGPQQQQAPQQAIPDAPKPQPSLPGLNSITPGKGVTPYSSTAPESADQPTAPSDGKPVSQIPAPPPAGSIADDADQPAPDSHAATIRVSVNEVEVPFTVKDSKGHLVAGLTYHDVRIYENGVRQYMQTFSTDAVPLSIALVIDQSLTHDVMGSVNTALGAIPGAFTKYDQVSVFTYNNGPRQVTAFTGAQSARLTQAIETSKTSGRDALLAGSLGGPLAHTTVINNQDTDPNTRTPGTHGAGMSLDAPKEVHTLNDAILAAAVSLTKAERGRRRVIYVISDGKEAGSKARFKDVVRYLQTNKIAVFGTLVGDSALPVAGFLDRISLPFMMKDNILPSYAAATGGNFDAETRTSGIEKSFAKIAEEVRTQYTIRYDTREPFIDGKYRRIEVKILRPNLLVLSKQGYYPSAVDAAPRTMTVSAPAAAAKPTPTPIPTPAPRP